MFVLTALRKGHWMIKEHETWNIIDSTKMNEYMDCPRKYFFKYILGWNMASQANHLAFGTAWHVAMEAMVAGPVNVAGNPQYTEEVIEKAFQAFLLEYRKEFSASTDAEVGVKTPDNAKMALQAYGKNYAGENFQVEHIELPGKVTIGFDTDGNEKVLHYNIDMVCDGPMGHFCLEHKTTTKNPWQWQNQWVLSIQVGTYVHTLKTMYDDVFGAIINGVILRAPQRVKKDGEPYANSKGTEFIRVPIRKTDDMMLVWLAIVNQLYDSIQRETGRLVEDVMAGTDSAMQSFPMNTNSCTKYGLCPYWDFCCAWPNPAARASELDVPIGYDKSYWNPKLRKRVEA